jgi:hypothetical protein
MKILSAKWPITFVWTACTGVSGQLLEAIMQNKQLLDTFFVPWQKMKFKKWFLQYVGIIIAI